MQENNILLFHTKHMGMSLMIKTFNISSVNDFWVQKESQK